MSGKRALLELLKQEGVEVLFGNPGTTELPLMDTIVTLSELRYYFFCIKTRRWRVLSNRTDEPDTNGLVGGDAGGEHGLQIHGFSSAY
jgi:hypothetical protein